MEMVDELRDHIEIRLVENGCGVEPCHLSSPREAVMHVNYRDRKFVVVISEDEE